MIKFKKLAPALLICALPMMSAAAETVPAVEGQKPAPLQSVPPTKPQTPEKAEQQLRVGYVDLSKLNQESDLGKSAQAQAKEMQKKLQTQIETRRKQLDKQKAALEKKFDTLSPAQKEAKAKEFQKKVEEFQTFGMGKEKELQTLQDKLLTDLSKSFEEAAVEYGKANKLALVIVKRELLYVSSAVDAQDVTDGVLALLNSKSKK
ncbi:OmpH family outer membrane protein [Pelotalea chapellei]|uniref:OmpH family outer membrane protein n=1 Tax=Pelotalea chapellei TaxID=44671 RepID=A0ABS5U8J4_9BACT|nr:OmpH family outer membrane protein [Pelotalea chapellei]MBT1071983.1 OmpH family outer membrane protein [Pelotalea chapellei]